MSQGQSNRWDVMAIREYTNSQNEQKSAWTKIGVAFTNKNGSINVVLDMVPCSVEGQVKLQLQVPLTAEEKERMFGPRDGGGQQRGGGQQQQRSGQQQQQQRGGNGGGYQQRGGGNPRNAGQQQRQGAQQRFGQRGQSQPQQLGFRPTEPYTEPEPDGDAGYVDAGAESGWEVNGKWITDARELPQDHPDFIPF